MQSGASSLPLLYHQSDNQTQPWTGNAALVAQQSEDAQQPIRYEDSGIRFGVHEGEPGPPQSQKGVPPTYTQN